MPSNDGSWHDRDMGIACTETPPDPRAYLFGRPNLHTCTVEGLHRIIHVYGTVMKNTHRHSRVMLSEHLTYDDTTKKLLLCTVWVYVGYSPLAVGRAEC